MGLRSGVLLLMYTRLCHQGAATGVPPLPSPGTPLPCV